MSKPDASPLDFYQLLGVEPLQNPGEIHAAYRAKIAHYHPDRNPSTHATAIAALINEAWEVLGSPDRRRDYDSTRNFGKTGGPSTPPQPHKPSNRARNPRAAAPAANDVPFTDSAAAPIAMGVE